MSQESFAVLVFYSHSTHLIAIYTGNAVVPGEAFVHERIISIQKSHRTAVLEGYAFKKHFRLALHRLSQIVIKIGKDIIDRILGLEISQVQPLSCEVRPQSSRTFVGKHPLDLSLQHCRLFQPSLDGKIDQLIIRNAAPYEERQT